MESMIIYTGLTLQLVNSILIKLSNMYFGGLSVKGNDPGSDDPNSNDKILKEIYTEIVGIADNEITL